MTPCQDSGGNQEARGPWSLEASRSAGVDLINRLVVGPGPVAFLAPVRRASIVAVASIVAICLHRCGDLHRCRGLSGAAPSASIVAVTFGFVFLGFKFNVVSDDVTRWRLGGGSGSA